MIDGADSATLRYALLEARLHDVVADSRRGAAPHVIYMWWAFVIAFGMSHLGGLISHLPTIPVVITTVALVVSLVLTVFHLVLEFRARRRELKARVLLIDGELLQARIAALRATLA